MDRDPIPRSVRWYPAATIVAAVVLSSVLYGRLPERMPTHWNAEGEVDGWSPRAVGAFLLPGVMALTAALLRLVPRVDPRRDHFARFGSAYAVMVNATMTLLLALHGITLAAALGHRIQVERVIPAAVGALLVVVGNVLPRARSNFFVGIRTPWTLSSDTVWARTHRLGGYTMTAAGVVAILGALTLPPRLIVAAMLVATVLGAVVPIAYSYVLWAREAGGGRADRRETPGA